MESSNPVLSEDIFRNYESYGDSTTMTLNGTAMKTVICIGLAFLTAGIVWFKFQELGGMLVEPNPAAFQAVTPFLFGGMIVGLISCLVTMFKPAWSPVTAPVYSLAEGFFLGGISAFVQSQFPGEEIVFQALGLTFGTAFVMMILYQTGTIRVTERLRSGVMIATGAICLLYLISFVMGMFNRPIGFIHEATPIGIAFSVFVVGLAAFNLLLDFDLIDRLSAQGSPKHMEWYGAFALMVTLVWLYIEILRLLSKLNRRD